MEFRKKLIRRELYQSDILNIKTGYYKTENISPITPKPTEVISKKKQFILVNDLLGTFYNRSFLDKKIYPLKRQNSEVLILRKYAKTIRENCFDENGNFSARKRFKFEFYGKIEKNNYINNKNYNKKRNKSIKEKRKMSLRKNSINSLIKSDMIDESKSKNYKRNYSCKNIDNKNDIYKDNKYLEYASYKKKENFKINIDNSSNQDTNQKKLNNTKNILNKKLTTTKSVAQSSVNIKTINKKLSTQYIKKQEQQTLENEDFYIEIKNENKKNNKNDILVDKIKLKQIFLKNGLHIYNFKEEGVNILPNNQKFEAKLRKNNKDENFDKNYRNVIRELNKINIKVNRSGMVYENCIFNKNSKIRKGTPGKNLKKNFHKFNYGFKRDKYILPIQNNDYKNDYIYNSKNYNHSKWKIE